MEVAGGDPWRQWKVEATSADLPLVPGDENEGHVVKRTPNPLPSLKMFRSSRPPDRESEPQQTSKVKEGEDAMLGLSTEVPIPPLGPKTGVSAALP